MASASELTWWIQISSSTKLRVGRFLKAHGLKGAIKLELYTDSPNERFVPGAVLELQVPEESPWFGKTVTVSELKWFNSSPVLFLKDVTDRTQAESLIKAILLERKYTLPSLPVPGEAHAKLSKRLEKSRAAKGDAPESSAPRVRMSAADQRAWEAAGLHCSANERRADEASRDVEAWLKCKYMREHLGEEYSGVVSAATSFGIFVTLDTLYVEGLVHITELGGEYFRFDELRQELRGERTGIRYAIGSRVQVQVSRVDLDGRKIDFRLVTPGEDLVPRAMRDKGVSGPAEGGRDKKRGAQDRRQADAERNRSPIQALKASVKKAAAKKKGARTSKPRR